VKTRTKIADRGSRMADASYRMPAGGGKAGGKAMAGVDVSANYRTNRAASFPNSDNRFCRCTTNGSLTLTSAPAEATVSLFRAGSRAAKRNFCRAKLR
jgi:hypothetical protein